MAAQELADYVLLAITQPRTTAPPPAGPSSGPFPDPTALPPRPPGPPSASGSSATHPYTVPQHSQSNTTAPLASAFARSRLQRDSGAATRLLDGQAPPPAAAAPSSGLAHGGWSGWHHQGGGGGGAQEFMAEQHLHVATALVSGHMEFAPEPLGATAPELLVALIRSCAQQQPPTQQQQQQQRSGAVGGGGPGAAAAAGAGAAYGVSGRPGPAAVLMGLEKAQQQQQQQQQAQQQVQQGGSVGGGAGARSGAGAGGGAAPYPGVWEGGGAAGGGVPSSTGAWEDVGSDRRLALLLALMARCTLDPDAFARCACFLHDGAVCRRGKAARSAARKIRRQPRPEHAAPVARCALVCVRLGGVCAFSVRWGRGGGGRGGGLPGRVLLRNRLRCRWLCEVLRPRAGGAEVGLERRVGGDVRVWARRYGLSHLVKEAMLPSEDARERYYAGASPFVCVAATAALRSLRCWRVAPGAPRSRGACACGCWLMRAGVYLLRHWQLNQQDKYWRMLRHLVLQAQQLNDDSLLDNPYLTVVHMLNVEGQA